MFSCPVDSYVFPELDKSREGDMLEARFNAFKIPESNFLVFEATVRTCREGCQPAYCSSGTGRSEPSFGRKKRSLNETEEEEEANTTMIISTMEDEGNQTKVFDDDKEQEFPEFVREMIEVCD